MTDKIVVFSTCGSGEEAERLARKLIDERLAACVTVVTPVRSFYRWQGVVEEAAEWLLVIKTSRELFSNLRQSLESAHSYQVPELIALPVVEGAPNYLAWMTSELQAAGAE
jgi:periplasmic divalent cation tolerance protein